MPRQRLLMNETLAREYVNGSFRDYVQGDFDRIAESWGSFRSVIWVRKTKKSFTCITNDGEQYHYQFLNLIGWNGDMYSLAQHFARRTP